MSLLLVLREKKCGSLRPPHAAPPASSFRVFLYVILSSGQQVLKLKIRRHDPDSDPRYYILSGSSPVPMVLGGGQRYVIVVESELDGILCHQEAGDLVTAVALGSSTVRPDRRSAELLNSADGILVSLDLDPAWATQVWRWWMDKFDRAIRWSPLPGYGKDPTEMWRAGINIRGWIEAGIADAQGRDMVKAF
jgi:DNA primase